ncbi:hypothetical protein SAMN04488109_1759 [Chryseolinea serpens]|uniref:Uncharacterized protein n=1 Tax=Chryseolinea serpens TaxID=947013 RepID=A0A1M5MIF6_9BACT|nr:hypothetical protein SAMN04488109_1759 [Chryseolinea serpens]
MFKKMKNLFRQYRDYIRVDLILYGVLLMMILVYLILTVLQVF